MQTRLDMWAKTASSGVAGKPQCQCQCMQKMETHLNEKLAELLPQALLQVLPQVLPQALQQVLQQQLLVQLTALVKPVVSEVVKDELPQTVLDDNLNYQPDEQHQDALNAEDALYIPPPPQDSLQCGVGAATAVKTESFDGNLLQQVGDIDISSDDEEQQSIAERVLAEVGPGDWDTQASQDRLLCSENRIELGARFARNQMATLSGRNLRNQNPFDPSDLRKKSSSDLSKLICEELDQIPEQDLRTSSRKNVRPDGQSTALQRSLGLMISGTFHGIPMPAKETYQSLQLQQLIFAYVERRAREQDLDLTRFTFTSIQINKNLRTKLHTDKNNHGLSLIFTLGDHTGGELFIEDADGSLQQDGVTGSLNTVSNTLVIFDGKKSHCTMPFEGERWAIILYATGTGYEQTPALARVFLKELGYKLPLATFKEEKETQEQQKLAKRAVRGEEVPDEPGRHLPPKAKRKADAMKSDNGGCRSKRSVAKTSQTGGHLARPAGEAEPPWSEREILALRGMKSPSRRWASENIAKKLGRSVASIISKWSEIKNTKDDELNVDTS